MTLRAFKDANDGYYQADTENIPEWAVNMTPCALIDVAPIHISPISPRQIRMALTRAALRAQVEAAVVAGNQDLKDWWEFSTLFERTNPQVVAMCAALGVSDAQCDALWQLGATL